MGRGIKDMPKARQAEEGTRRQKEARRSPAWTLLLGVKVTHTSVFHSHTYRKYFHSYHGVRMKGSML